jgi:hypothetical protein
MADLEARACRHKRIRPLSGYSIPWHPFTAGRREMFANDSDVRKLSARPIWGPHLSQRR